MGDHILTSQVFQNREDLRMTRGDFDRYLSQAIAEKDREIERLRSGWDASEARFDADVEASRADLERDLTDSNRRVGELEYELSASQAREREAVADRESAIQKARVFTRENEILHDSLLKIERTYKDTESALAAARKALEDAQTLIESGSPQMALMVISAALNGDSHATR